MQVFARSPKKLLRQYSREIGIDKSSVHRILQAHKWKPWVSILFHALNEDDSDRRLQFCEWFLHTSVTKGKILDSIVWSDEATFKLNGTINWHNCVYRAKKKGKYRRRKYRQTSMSSNMVWSVFQRSNWDILLRRDYHGSDIPANVGNQDSTC